MKNGPVHNKCGLGRSRFICIKALAARFSLSSTKALGYLSKAVHNEAGNIGHTGQHNEQESTH